VEGINAIDILPALFRNFPSPKFCHLGRKLDACHVNVSRYVLFIIFIGARISLTLSFCL